MKLRTLIVDDEHFARTKIRKFLEEYPEFEVIGECEDAKQTAAAILTHKPDVAFMDIEIPGQNGLELLDSLPPDVQPAVIFVTAFDRYAVRAFESRAIDYLLKPFNKARFAEALSRIHERRALWNGAERKQALKEVLQEIRRENQNRERIVVKTGARLIVLRSSLIEWVEAERNLVKLHVGKECHMLRETMSVMMERLDPGRFVRIHRCTIVNLDFVRELRPLWSGGYTVFMRDGTQLTLSRSYRSNLKAKSLEGSSAGMRRLGR